MLFRLPSEEELTDNKLNEFIAKHNAECAFRFKHLKDAYETDYQIFHQKPKPNYKPDNRIAVNFAKYMVDPGCHCSVAAYMDDELYEEWINSYQEHGLNFETWKQLHEEETYESEMGRRLVNRITGISKQKKIFNEGLKTTSNEDVKTLLKQSLGRTEIARLSGRKSYYSAKEKKIYLSKDAKSDTIAHELFHEIDDTYALVENGMLKNSVQQDYRRLQNQAKRYGKSIEEMLYLEYPEAFEVSKYGIKFKEEYRGISDILNGMSNGDILMGYSHKTDYWKKSGRLEKESWAQYGRMFYTDGKALEMAKKIFPEMSQEIEQRIRRLMK